MVSTKLCGKMQISEKLLPVFIVFVYGFDTAWARGTISAQLDRVHPHPLNVPTQNQKVHNLFGK